MPRFLEKILQQAAASRGITGRQADRYTFGAMNNMGAMKGNQETAKGARMDAKHDAQHDAKARAPRSNHPHKNLGRYLHPKKAR